MATRTIRRISKAGPGSAKARPRRASRQAHPLVDQRTTDKLLVDVPLNGKKSGQTQGSAIRRLTYHYWYHIGEIQAIRQQLRDNPLPIYVGNIEGKAPYRPE